jgi:hypothetical protein
LSPTVLSGLKVEALSGVAVEADLGMSDRLP